MKYICIHFFLYIKMTSSVIKNTKKDSERKSEEDIKIFLKKKKFKGEKMLQKYIKILLTKKKKNG